MDPEQALAEARAALADYRTAQTNNRDHRDDHLVVDAADRLADAFEALDGWLSAGGYRPDDWNPR
jgi:hypothetical protein